MLKELNDGLGCLSEGFALARRPALRPYLIVPLVANILLFSISGYFVIKLFFDWINGWTGAVDLWSWLDWLESFINNILGAIKWIVFGLVISVLLFVMSSTFTMITHLLISPFIGILGEQAERQLHNPNYPPSTLMQIAWRTLKRELGKMFYWLWRAMGLAFLTLILYFTPLNLLIPPMWFLFGAWILAMQYIDVAADNNGRSFRELLVLLDKHKIATLAFGSVVMALTSIPILNLFIVPVAVCGGVVFWVKKLTPHLVPAGG